VDEVDDAIIDYIVLMRLQDRDLNRAMSLA